MSSLASKEIASSSDMEACAARSHSDDDSACAAAQRRPFVEETRFYKSLHFSALEAQSRMLKREPDRLVLDYTRTMMAFLLFTKTPLHIAMIGLGGGSLAKFCYRELSCARIDVAEINPHVVALRDAFGVPPDDERFKVHLRDGADFIRKSPACFDVLLIDAYTREGIPTQLASAHFYDGCRDSLRNDGILVSNLYCNDSDRHVEEIARSFGTRVIVVDEAEGTNRVVIAVRSAQSLLQQTMHRPAHIRPLAWSSLQAALLRVRSAIRNGSSSKPARKRRIAIASP